MKYYEKLIREIDKSMKAHPRSTVVMDADSLKIVSFGKDAEKVARKFRRARLGQGRTVIFQAPEKDAVWILATQSAL